MLILLLNHLYRTNIFCDKYDPIQNTYCKRLRVLCPEHTKEPKVICVLFVNKQPTALYTHC